MSRIYKLSIIAQITIAQIYIIYDAESVRFWNPIDSKLLPNGRDTVKKKKIK